MSDRFQNNISLADYTSFGVGGPAEFFAIASGTDELIEILRANTYGPLWVLGYGSNSLVSDHGLPRLTVVTHGGSMVLTDTSLVADAGVWWDDVVKTAVTHGLWGIEFMSEVPGSVGAAVFINITAYGQSIGPLIEWVEAWDTIESRVIKITREELVWGYKQSVFQQPKNAGLVILRICLQLNRRPTDELNYQKAIDVAGELGLSSDSLEDRRKIIIEARARAGSLWHPGRSEARTVGSFFRNPTVPTELVEKLAVFDESGKTAEEIKKMNRVHGGSEQRVSAAHVMLAAGFSRGQTWGNVKLNDHNLLKLEALAGATAQEIYNVAMDIQRTCEEKLGVRLEPEARILGEF